MLGAMKPAKLFHAIVITGAALTGCGDDDRVATDDAVADAGSVDAGEAVDAAMGEDAGSEEDAFVAIL